MEPSLDVQLDAFERYSAAHDGTILKLFRIAETATKPQERRVLGNSWTMPVRKVLKGTQSLHDETVTILESLSLPGAEGAILQARGCLLQASIDLANENFKRADQHLQRVVWLYQITLPRGSKETVSAVLRYAQVFRKLDRVSEAILIEAKIASLNRYRK